MGKDTIGLNDLREGIIVPESVDTDYDIFDSAPTTWDQVDSAREYMIKATESSANFDSAMLLVSHSMEALDQYINRELGIKHSRSTEDGNANDDAGSDNKETNNASQNSTDKEKEPGFWKNVIKGIQKAFDAIIDFFKKVWQHVSNFFKWIWDCITGKNKKNDLKQKAEDIKNANLDDVVQTEDAKDAVEKNSNNGQESYIYGKSLLSLEAATSVTRRELLANTKLKLTDWPRLKRDILENNSALPLVLTELEQAVKNEQYNPRDIGGVLSKMDKDLENITVTTDHVSGEEIKNILTVASSDVIPSSEKYIKEFTSLSNDLVHRLDSVRHSIGGSNNGEYATKEYLDHLREIQKLYETLTRHTKSGDMIVVRFAKMYNNDINKLHFIMKIKSKSAA